MIGKSMGGRKQNVDEERVRLEESHSKTKLIYGLEDNPPWYACIWLGLQQCFCSATSIAFVPILLGPHMCMMDDEEGYLAKTKFTSALYFASGVVTILQCTLGTRLPILQGTPFSFLAPILAVLALPHNQCPSPEVNSTTQNLTGLFNDTDGTLVDATELWQRRIREIQGSLAVASVAEVFIGITGATRILMRFIGPLTIAPAIAVIGLDLFAEAAKESAGHWGIAIFTIAVLTLLSQYFYGVAVPIPTFNRKKGCHITRTKPFGLFPVLITVFLAWGLCYILTVAGNLPTDPSEAGYSARTDIKSEAISVSPWIYFPYPGHMGMPTVSGAGVIAMLVAIFGGAVESIGDYHACAKLVEAPPPPPHVIARGITAEGIGCIFAGLISAEGSTSFSNNIAAIGITKVGSRRVMISAGIIFVFMGIFSKFGAIFVMIPSPVIGGVFCVTFGMLAAVGLSMLQYVNMNLPRNQYILGFSLFMGLVIPEWMKKNQGAINTGVDLLDQTFTVLLTTAIFVSGFIAAVLDNTMPGTLQDRGILGWKQTSVATDDSVALDESCYDLPFPTDSRIAKYLPICPQYGIRRRKNKKSHCDNMNGAAIVDGERDRNNMNGAAIVNEERVMETE